MFKEMLIYYHPGKKISPLRQKRRFAFAYKSSTYVPDLAGHP